MRIVAREHHLYIPCNDSSIQDLPPHLAGICDFIDQFRHHSPTGSDPVSLATDPAPVPKVAAPVSEIPAAAPEAAEPVPEIPGILIHCEMGISRSATALIAYLMRTHWWSFDDTLAFVRAKQKVRPNSNFKEQLIVWDETGYEIWEEAEKMIPKSPYALYLERRAERLKALGLTGDEPVFLAS